MLLSQLFQLSGKHLHQKLLGMVVYILSPIAVGQRQEDLCEPGASLLFILSFRPAELHSETLS